MVLAMIERISIPKGDDNFRRGNWVVIEGQPAHRCPLCGNAAKMTNHSVEPNGEVNASIACFAPCAYHVWGILQGWTYGKKYARCKIGEGPPTPFD